MRLIGLVLAVSLTLAPLAAEGQQGRKLYRIGYMSVRADPTEPNEPVPSENPSIAIVLRFVD